MKIVSNGRSWPKWWLVVAMSGAMLTPASAEGQLGGLRDRAKKAVAQAAGVEAAAPASTANAASAATSETGYVLTMTPAVLDRLEAALAAEYTEFDVVEREFQARPTPEVRAACEHALMQGPEGQKILADYMAALEKAGEDPDAAMKAMQAMDQAMRALYARECGEPFTDEEARELQQRPHVIGAEAGGFTTIQYAILKERVPPFCEGGADLRQDEGGASAPGVDERNRYVYGADEVEALRTRCEALTLALAAVA